MKLALLALPLFSTLASSVTFSPQGDRADVGPKPDDPAAWVAGADPARIARSVLTIEVDCNPNRDVVGKLEKVVVPVRNAVVVGPEVLVTSLAGLQNAKLTWRGAKPPVTLEVIGFSAPDNLAVLAPSKKGDAAATARALWLPLAAGSETELGDDGTYTLFLSPSRPQEARSIPWSQHFEAPFNTLDPGEFRRDFANLPIVDESGALLGLWRWPEDGAKDTPVAAERVLAAVTAALAKPTPLTDAVGTRSPPYSFPRLLWATQKAEAGVDNAIKRAREIVTNTRCPACSGVGYEVKNVTKTVPGKRKSQQETIQIPCPRCQEGRVGSREQVWKGVRLIAHHVTSVDPDTVARQGVLQALEAGVREAAALNPAQFRARLQEKALEELAPHKVVPGRAVGFLVDDSAWPQGAIGNWEHEVVEVSHETLNLLLVHPKAQIVRGKGNEAFVVGVIAGTVQRDDKVWVVLERPWAVPLTDAAAPR
ncbi:MAG: hypothetical protein R3F49_18805 [Planctomycetota bacterium]